MSFTAEQLAENYGAVYDEILRMKPAAAKGKYECAPYPVTLLRAGGATFYERVSHDFFGE